MVGDLQYRADVTSGVGKATRPPVFGVRLAHAVFQRNLIVRPPQRLAGRYLDRGNDEGSAFKRLRVVSVGGDRHVGAPFPVETPGQSSDQIQRVGVPIH